VTDTAICDRHINLQGQVFSIPPQLLTAIGVVESGRWRTGGDTVCPWPWTVTAAAVDGGGRFFVTRDEAVAWVLALQAEGIRKIDVGCLQITLTPSSVSRMPSPLPPNVAYGASYLARQYAMTRGWAQAVGNYHSSTRSYHRAYRGKVLHAWPLEQRQASELRRQTRIAALARELSPFS